MPRRGRSAPVRAQAAPAPPVPRATAAPAPVHAQPPMVMQQQPKQPGLFANMASTAAGVAVGSAVGHTVGHMITGGGGSSQPQQPAPVQQYQPPPQQQQQYNPCQTDLDKFLECSKTQSDISLCAGFNEALKECRVRFGQT